MQGKTRTGFKYEISDDLMDDYELIEQINYVEENPAYVTKFVKFVLGEEQTKSLKEHCRGENGRVSTKRMNEELSDILGSGDLKK